jgi:hypothetical protein
MATGEVYIQLAVNFADNRKVRSLKRYGRDARAIRDLFVQMICHCKETLSDGFVGDDQIGLLVFPDSEKTGMRDAERLAAVGLIEKVTDGYMVTGFLERNPSKADVLRRAEAKAAGARMANHKRWHIEEGVSDPRCVLCQKSDQTSDRTTDRTSDQSTDSDRVSADSGSESTESETESKSETETDRSERAPECGSDEDPDFAAFWDAYPNKVGKGAARRAWRSAIRSRHDDPKQIILAAEHFRDLCQRERTEKKYIPHPSTWLNGERYNDDPGSPGGGGRITYPTSPWDN